MAANKYSLANMDAKLYLQKIVDQYKTTSPNLIGLQKIAPPAVRDAFVSKYKTGLATNPKSTWELVIKELTVMIITAASKLAPDFKITADNLELAYDSLYPKCQPVRIRGSQLKYKKIGPVTGPLQRTFIISGQSGIDHGPLRHMLNDMGFVEKTVEEVESVGILFLEQTYHYNYKESLRYDPRTSELTCNVKSILPEDKSCIANKEKLYQNLMMQNPEIASQYLAETRKLIDVNEVLPGEVLILKPVGSAAGCGFGIQIVTNTSELTEAKSQILAEYPSGIASRYIMNPLLFGGKKFHLRMYLLVRGPITCSRCSRGRGSCSVCENKRYHEPHIELFPRGRILTARDDYQLDDFSNADIHDSHIKSTAQNYFFPEDFQYCHTMEGFGFDNPNETAASIYDQMATISQLVGQVIKQKMRKWTYPESNFAYEVFGCDFMIEMQDQGAQVILLEINDRVSNRPAFGDSEPPNWPPEEKPGLYEWDLTAYQDSPFYENLHEYINFSSQIWYWVLEQGIIPFYNFFEPEPKSDIPKTYMISGWNGSNHAPLREIMSSRGFKEVLITDRPQFIGYMCLEQQLIRGAPAYDKRAYKFSSYVKSLLSTPRYIITDKGRLYQELKKIAPSIAETYMAHTQPASEVTHVTEPVIVKPISQPGKFVGSGQGIKVVTNYEDLVEHAAKLRKDLGSEPIVSTYIADPWLIDGKKMHLRMYLLIRTEGISTRGNPVPYGYFYWDIGKALTAKLPYQFANFGNPDIHDSHVKSTDRDRFFDLVNSDTSDTNMTLEERKYLYQQMVEVITPIGELMRNHSVPYEDSNYAYEVFGLDFMVRKDTLTVVLLEINDHIGMHSSDAQRIKGFHPQTGPWTPKYTEFSRKYWTWIHENGIQPFFE